MGTVNCKLFQYSLLSSVGWNLAQQQNGNAPIDLSDNSFVAIFTEKSAAKRKSVSREDIFRVMVYTITIFFLYCKLVTESKADR